MPPLDKRIKKFIKDSIRVAPRISEKGELGELRTGLVSQYPQTRKDAIKKTIQQMTLGKDVSSLFPDVVKNIATNDVEQKKLVYLYVMNYAETHPELCILVVNTFVTDAQDPNPLIRCMAIRTMCMIRVDKILEYIEIPLRRTLQDDNPYVRKTAVICIAKLFQLNKELCVEIGVLDDLIAALDDSNPMVVANATAALTEISVMDPDAVLLLDLISSHVNQYLLALNECTEWARITILTALTEYQAKDSIEAQQIIDRVTAHLQHVNPAVVLSTIKVIIRNLELTQPQSSNSVIMKKMTSALVSLMSTPPELQYIALKNIRIILEKYPELLSKELRIFYVKFNDPLYVKLEKIEIMVRLVDPANTKQCQLLLSELKEYTMEFEPEFVSRSIQALSQLGIKYSHETFVSKVLDILIDFQERQESYKDECCSAMCDLLRHCSTNDEMITSVCAILNAWSDPDSMLQRDDAKCNYIWLLGQYPIKFPSLTEKISIFVDNFVHEEPLTQTSILMTIVRLHSQLPGSILQNILELATNQTNEIDVRDLAMMYWRCLSMPNVEGLVKQLCSMNLPQIASTLDKLSPDVLEKLLRELSTISSITLKPQVDNKNKYAQHQRVIRGKHLDELKDIAKNELAYNMNDEVLLDFDDNDNDDNYSSNNSNPIQNSSALDDLDDLFNFGNNTNSNADGSAIEQGIYDLDIHKKDNHDQETSSNTQELLDLF
ncbi:hypothetical protein TPHA_0G02830 [Tetrapisispora phaffii CBS 4417]|uniref:AP complex subunit beta n=1 Tax=Tetrapisispora phaffii (strain ATCC 24235 / CBS 4417 / NBRC 1672 / NRRL Y-8282 / UCD 70-5) TaxID=1071381 RepID=G8BW43_TETPH|nr:hypothetical protein TPHA_0G02830 [Tetrapisispora phaffii CBS 4417]CCE64121.1 hypothetical protein TPHA_0G02830 [Tetrapisispora phaffii CBS 4417]